MFVGGDGWRGWLDGMVGGDGEMVVFVGGVMFVGGNTRDVYPFFPRLKKGGWKQSCVMWWDGGLGLGFQALPSRPNHIRTPPQLHPWQGSQHVISNSLGNIQDQKIKTPCPNLVTHQTRSLQISPTVRNLILRQNLGCCGQACEKYM